MDYFFFYAGLSLMLTHEMDAVRLQEWKLFPFLSGLNDQSGYLVFTSLHVVLYILLFWGLWGGHSEQTVETVRLSLDCFFAIHIILHWLLRNHIDNRFNNPFSWSLIVGSGLAGLLDVLIS